MKELMVLIRNEGAYQVTWSPEKHQRFPRECMDYISNLTKEGKPKSAQPLERHGKIVSGSKGAFKAGPFDEGKEVNVGYFHVLARDMDESIEIAEANPEYDMEQLQELKSVRHKSRKKVRAISTLTKLDKS